MHPSALPPLTSGQGGGFGAGGETNKVCVCVEVPLGVHVTMQTAYITYGSFPACPLPTTSRQVFGDLLRRGAGLALVDIRVGALDISLSSRQCDMVHHMITLPDQPGTAGDARGRRAQAVPSAPDPPSPPTQPQPPSALDG